MARYNLYIKPSAVKEIEAIPKKDRLRIIEKIKGLAENPRTPGCEKISGRDRFRIRQGRYRILYSVDDLDLVIRVVKVGHRREIYR